MTLLFLTLDEVLAIQSEQIALYGGQGGVRDQGLLSSALAMAEASFDGEYLHPSLHEMAAAYLFHVCKNHPFIDGNKRTALASSLAFLWINGQEVVVDPNDMAGLVEGVAEGNVGKAEIAVYLAKHSKKITG